MHSDEEIISQDYENDALVHLKRILQNKWDFVVMQAEEQVGTGEIGGHGDRIQPIV